MNFFTSAWILIIRRRTNSAVSFVPAAADSIGVQIDNRKAKSCASVKPSRNVAMQPTQRPTRAATNTNGATIPYRDKWARDCDTSQSHICFFFLPSSCPYSSTMRYCVYDWIQTINYVFILLYVLLFWLIYGRIRIYSYVLRALNIYLLDYCAAYASVCLFIRI